MSPPSPLPRQRNRPSTGWQRCSRWVCCVVLLGCGSRSGLYAGETPRAVQEGTQIVETERGEGAGPTRLDEALGVRTGCIDITRRYSSVPATVMLLIDRSHSMLFDFGQSTRWDVLRQAIVDPERGLLASLDAEATIGLMLYTGQNGFDNPLGCPLVTEVEGRFGDVEAVRRAYLAAEPQLGGDTPTGESIDRAALALAAVNPGAPKYLLLATDGVPDTCAQPKPSAGLPQAVAAARRAFDQGIVVYTLGVSEGIGADGLQRLANAGSGKDPGLVYGRDPEAEPPLSASDDPRQLAAQLAGIIGDVRSCTIDLGEPIDPGRGLDGRVVLDGQVLDSDPFEGWSLLDDRTLAVRGAACEQILGDGEMLEIRFPCEPGDSPL